MTEQDLLKLKRQVEDAKTEVNQLQGQRTALLKQLKDDWGCKTVEEAEAKVKAMEKEIEKISDQILREVIGTFHKISSKPLFVDVRATNQTALKAYEKIGFIEYGRHTVDDVERVILCKR